MSEEERKHLELQLVSSKSNIQLARMYLDAIEIIFQLDKNNIEIQSMIENIHNKIKEKGGI